MRVSQSTLCGLIIACGCSGSISPQDDPDAPIITNTGAPDADGDGVSDADEARLGTDANRVDTDGDGLNDGLEITLGSDPLREDSDGDGLNDADEVAVGRDPTRPDAACAEKQAEATLVTRPADIILVIDSSGSMTGEIAAVRRNIDENFARILKDSALDYRIILIADFGMGEDNTICIGAPLSTTNCDCDSNGCKTPDAPSNTDRFFHYDLEVGSHDSLALILDSYREPDPHGLAPHGWSSWLRPDAMKVFVELSDDDPKTKIAGERLEDDNPEQAAAFDAALLALDPAQFGTAPERRYVWHSIIGLQENSPAVAPWQPTDAIQENMCAEGAKSPAVTYQRLSVATGGLRFPMCNNDSFDSVFRDIARGVVSGATLPCEYNLPAAPDGKVLDVDRMLLRFSPGNGSPLTLGRVSSAADCTTGDYFLGADSIKLCAQRCDSVANDPAGQISLQVACERPGVQ